jgi:hypothetical protein
MQVNVSGLAGGVVNLTMLQTVDADLDLLDGTPRVLLDVSKPVPEPGILSVLVPGVAMLWLLNRRRVNRRE